MGTQEGYRSKSSVRKHSPVLVSCLSPLGFRHLFSFEDVETRSRISARNRARESVRVSIDAVSCVQCAALAGGRIRVVREDLRPIRNIGISGKIFQAPRIFF
ncbi:hypothetical protein AVEN_81565-1 [Araneus ventricosus]|uniref:Uncharacterized protein n=1 Tax=Araneus ventricosus TaxID=182803 RepID=A0A4Y2PFN5_ARAVE|nr:hypothetical protein AVEN_81565-1 [Araneus ventricosus]